jgi:hypothetical protein
MNRNEQDKFVLARKKIMEAHYLDQAVVTDNRRYRGYKSLMETILESTDNMEKTEQLPHFMSWVLRDKDGLSLMFELMQRIPSVVPPAAYRLSLMYDFLQRMPSLCENVGTRAHAVRAVVPEVVEEVPAAKKMRSE